MEDFSQGKRETGTFSIKIGKQLPIACHAERSEVSPVVPHESPGTRDTSLRSA